MARLALETTLLTHGVPATAAPALHDELARICREHGAEPALCAVVGGRATASLSSGGLTALLERPGVEKLNTSGLHAALAQGRSGATTVSTTIEIAWSRGIRVFSTGGLGGVHKGFAQSLDISTDLLALARWPVAVVASGCKSILDVPATRELLETLGVPVLGWCTDRFPAFYRRDGGAGVDARFDDAGALARCVRATLARTGRGVLIASPIPVDHELPSADWQAWLAQAEAHAHASGATGRDVTPATLGALHTVSAGRTLRANIELVKANVRLGAQLAVYIEGE
jgi:pseudouridine-5'-phosphate glycosidase